ncbi:hypothetical protein K6U06_22865 [Acidiferrimicrobium sp. IK]|uniref:hypothetical protein n=1 Tax=Acidiferrimicrobium sp. IK TaxID=2871700 RepID=UPI0021CB0B22|nr:hypothetical protein [Acidiferrimicrobium sp. IK]MCU4187222.1 hypothetical protein [Acidiferrimicrobium sp. IK]
MTTAPALFARLAADLEQRLSRPATGPSAATWAAREPALAGIGRAADAVARCRTSDPLEARAALSALLRLAGDDRLAADAAMAAVIPALRAVAGGLTRAWRADPDEIDQATAAAGWERIVALAGHTVAWPDRVVAAGARDLVRDRLRSGTRRRPPDPLPDGDGDGPGMAARAPEGCERAEVVDLLRRAVEERVVTPAAVAVLWDLRAMRTPAADAARRDGRNPAAVRTQCRRAEAALRRHLSGGEPAGLADAG